ncbi:ATP-binding cassette domain-containing protein [Vibrio sp. JC009]|uniref:ATP-binding cassette domain-containing protein n=1 Tax=Vibrio sp. JC009 TaxID=2912314 RepID=UPI0023B084B8|nr:ATP-binding cassette domain-containing protein [Vibrio sp. JC009]WED23316.1 ATP-binding cassette domain-containing protein [Vibrio sp. JC009]
MELRQLKASTATFCLDIDEWKIEEKESWGVFNTDGDIGSLLGDLLCNERLPESGEIETDDLTVAQVSLVEQQRLLEIELANDDTDFMDRIDTGTTVYSLLFDFCNDELLTETLLIDLNLEHLRDSGFRELSTGETRRLMLAKALCKRPMLLVLDEPYAGLDIAHRKSLAEYLERISAFTQMIVIVSREEDMPGWINKVALFNKGKLEATMSKSSWDGHPVISQIKAQSLEQSQQMLELIRNHKHQARFDNPVFQLTNGRVAYTEKTIFTDVNWRINNNEHWQIRGPNGCGKSTLLGLIFGDHPQCYSNDIQIFGRQRGSGETIWDIKKNIGMVSSALHLQYRVNCSALEVILSGFYDSIGLYEKPSKSEIQLAKEWLEILHMSQFTNTSFRQLEYGQQRLLLIARAIVKRPTLLILDEPYQGLDFLGRRLVKNTLELIAREHLNQLLYVSHYEDDALDSIHNYLDFVPDSEESGYKATITTLEPVPASNVMTLLTRLNS